jgi:hypothetical protein
MNNEFIEPQEEVNRVAEEICLLRKDIQAASAALNRIERRLKAAFPKYPTKNKQPREKKYNAKIVSSKNAAELQSIFNDLVSYTQNGGDSAFADKIGELKNEDVVALASEIGISSRNRLSRNKAADGIRKRVQEVMQLQFEKI